jgi:hypothetical protein
MVPERELEALGDLNKLGKFHITAGLHFGRGEITGDMAMYYDEKLLGDWGGGGLGSELLDAVPEDTIMAVSQSMKMEVVKKWFDDRPGIKQDIEEALQSEFGMSLDEALGAFEGDLVFALTDWDMQRTPFGRMPRPGILFGATIKDRDKVEKLLAEPMRELERDDDAPVRLVISDQVFFFCSPDYERDLEKNGRVDNPISGEKRNLLANNDTGYFMDYQQMDRMIESMTDPRMGNEELAVIADALGDLGLFSVTWNAEAGAQEIKARLQMPKEDENSLKQIIDSALSAAIAYNRNMRRRYEDNWNEPADPDPIDPNWHGEDEKMEDPSPGDFGGGPTNTPPSYKKDFK